MATTAAPEAPTADSIRTEHVDRVKALHDEATEAEARAKRKLDEMAHAISEAQMAGVPYTTLGEAIGATRQYANLLSQQVRSGQRPLPS